MKKTIYDQQPAVLQARGDGAYYYRWDISSFEITENEVTTTKWSCYEVIVFATVTSNKITEAVINAMWGNGIEQKLLNDYNASLLGVLPALAGQPYLDFLSQRKALKEQIDADSRLYNIL
jgi:hypothetical protein